MAFNNSLVQDSFMNKPHIKVQKINNMREGRPHNTWTSSSVSPSCPNSHVFHLIIVVRGTFPDLLHATLADRDPLCLLILSIKCLFHTMHVCGACLRRWRARWSEREKLRSQSLHLNGLTPVCLR